MERTAADINARLKSTEIVVKWISVILSGFVVGGIFIIRMRYDVDAHKASVSTAPAIVAASIEDAVSSGRFCVGANYTVREVAKNLGVGLSKGLISMNAITSLTTLYQTRLGVVTNHGSSSATPSGSPTPLKGCLHARNSAGSYNGFSTQRISGWSLGRSFPTEASHNAYMLSYETLLLALGAPSAA